MPDTTRESPRGDSFAELVCADPDWVRTEFAAIVAANFPATADSLPLAVRGEPLAHTGRRLPRRRPSGRQRSPPSASHACPLSSSFGS
jgi:hypothetical protein